MSKRRTPRQEATARREAFEAAFAYHESFLIDSLAAAQIATTEIKKE